MKHKYYWTCPYCEANLDPGEKCDCRNKEGSKTETFIVDNYKSVQGGENNVSRTQNS